MYTFLNIPLQVLWVYESDVLTHVAEMSPTICNV
jgi:hypothetical protein